MRVFPPKAFRLAPEETSLSKRKTASIPTIWLFARGQSSQFKTWDWGNFSISQLNLTSFERKAVVSHYNFGRWRCLFAIELDTGRLWTWLLFPVWLSKRQHIHWQRKSLLENNPPKPDPAQSVLLLLSSTNTQLYSSVQRPQPTSEYSLLVPSR